MSFFYFDWSECNIFVLVLQEQPLDDQEMEEDLIYVSQKLNEIEQTLSRLEKIKWGASFRWSSCLYCPTRNLDETTITKAYPSLYLMGVS